MSVEGMRQALLEKQAEGTAMPTNEDQTNKSVANVHPNPTPSRDGTVNARWGEKPKVDREGYPVAHSTGAQTEAKGDRAELLERLFDSFQGASANAKALVKEHFDHAGERESHSPLLHEKTAHVDEPQTLSERVRRLI